jgi:membrane-associated phospholipid phosphatase
MSPRLKHRPAIRSWAVALALSLSPFASRPASAARPTPDFAKYRFELAGAVPHPLITGDAAGISWRQALLVGLSGMNIAGLTGMNAASADPGAADESGIALLPWTGLGPNALAMFSGSKAILHLSAVAGTLLIVQSGLDKNVHNYFARRPSFGTISWPGVVTGSIFPVILGGGLYLSGRSGNSRELTSAGSAVLQASLLAVSYSTFLKALTGRAHPEPVVYEDNAAGSTFHFGLLRGGVFWGWPSGHMLANTAAVTSLLTFYKDKTWLKVAGGAYLGYLFLSVVSLNRSSMHWFSDAVAGTLMGVAIGTTVGRDFRRRWEDRQYNAAGLTFSASPHLFAVSFSIGL